MSRCTHCEYKICPGRDCIKVKCPMYDKNLPHTTCRCIANNYDEYEDCPYFKEATSEFEVSRTLSGGAEETLCNNVIFACKYHTREFNTLEELMDFIKNEANNKVVIQWNEFSNLYEVEIYDDWRDKREQM